MKFEARVTFRILPSSTAVNKPDDYGEEEIVKTVLAWEKYGTSWVVLQQREGQEVFQHVPKKFVALIMILQPKGPWPARDYKAAKVQELREKLREEWEPYPLTQPSDPES